MGVSSTNGLAAEAPAIFNAVWAWADRAMPVSDANTEKIAIIVFVALIRVAPWLSP
jgi:hypothetical protein